ncbi:MAG: DUF503 domain-containing protein [Anaerovoracaceae bacterium]|jgi:uncharacterized protein YlxP (DUF503 family)
MIIGILKIRIHIPWSHSLKEKRSVVKSICGRVKNKFNVSIAEVEEHDLHQIIVLGISYVTNDGAQAHRIGENVLNFIQSNTEGDIIDIERELY